MKILDENKSSEYQKQTQWAEFAELKKIILEVYKRKKSQLKILDIGVGDGRILKHFAEIKEIWNLIQEYEGIDISQRYLDHANKIIKKLKIEKKANVRLLNAIELDSLNKKYDLIILTGFTAGHFYPFNFDFNKIQGYDMSTNDKFTMIFKQVYALLNSKGEIVLGSVYVDNESTRKKQEEFYKSIGRVILTNEKDCFVATKNLHWSQRFTKKRIYDYLNFIPKRKFTFLSLDEYEFAMMIRIKK